MAANFGPSGPILAADQIWRDRALVLSTNSRLVGGFLTLYGVMDVDKVRRSTERTSSHLNIRAEA